jgi:hypothetical protein
VRHHQYVTAAALFLAMIPIGIPLACAEHGGTTFSVTPTSLSFTVAFGSTAIQQQSLSVSSARGIRISVSASGTSEGTTWLSVSHLEISPHHRS